MNHNPMHSLMNPKSIAIVGANNNPMKMGTMHALSIVKGGFKGNFYPLHPKEDTIIGYKAYKSAGDLPEAPDLVVLVIPTTGVPAMLEDFAKIGTKSSVIITAGFKETGDQGKILEEEIQNISKKYGIRFIGPNCIGIINSAISMNTTVISLESTPGKLGLISQSGTYVAQALPYLHRRGIAISKAVSIGNEADVSIIDVLEYLGDDDDTKAIILYLEGLKEGKRFAETAQKITTRKPVLALYSGGTEAGSRSSVSHTGAMAGPDYLYQGIFKQAGIIQVDTLEDLFMHGWAHASLPPVRGKRLGVITNSGGPGTSAASTCNRGGMSVPIFSSELQKKLRTHLMSHSPCGNPVDMTFDTNMEMLALTLPEIVMPSGEVDGIIIHGTMGTGFLKAEYPNMKELLGNVPLEQLIESTKRDFTGIVSLPSKYSMPVIVSSLFDRDDDFINAYVQSGIPVFDAPEKAGRCMLSLAHYHDIKERKKIIKPRLPELNTEAEGIIKDAIKQGQKALDEHQAKRVLSLYGVPTVYETITHNEDDAAKAASSAGFPVVLKACSYEILHKTEKGVIYLGLTDEKGVRDAFNKIKKSAGHTVPVLVQAMVHGNRELVAGMTRFPGFGPCILFGLGGIFTEAYHDTTIRVAPLSETETEEMLSDIRAAGILGEFRGMPKVNSGALGSILTALGSIALLHPEISEIDCNPIMIQGSEPVVVDSLMALRKA